MTNQKNICYQNSQNSLGRLVVPSAGLYHWSLVTHCLLALLSRKALFAGAIFFSRMLTMTCQSSLLIRVLNELCLPVCTLKSDFQLPRHLQLIWLHAKHAALPYFSGSSALLLKTNCSKKKVLFFSVLFFFYYIPYVCVADFGAPAESKHKNCISSANDRSQAAKRCPKYQPLYLCWRCYAFVLQHHPVLICHIQRERSWYAENSAESNTNGAGNEALSV